MTIENANRDRIARAKDERRRREERNDQALETWDLEVHPERGGFYVLPAKFLPWLTHALEERGYRLVE